MNDPLQEHFNTLNQQTSNKKGLAKQMKKNKDSLMFSDEFNEYFPNGLPSNLPDFPWTKYKDSDWSDSQLTSIPKKEKLCIPEDIVWTLAYAVEHDNYSMLIGPPGTAKTAFVKQLAHHKNQPFVRIQGVEDMDTATMIGAETFKNNEISYKHGIISNSVKNGYMLLLDEKNRMPGSIGFALQGLLERNGDLLLPNSEGSNEDRVVKRHKAFRVLAADNSLGFGDAHGIIFQQQDISSLDRAENIVNFSYLDPKEEVSYWENEYKLSNILIKDLVSFANLTRGSYKTEDILIGLTARSMRPILEKLDLYETLDKQTIRLHLNNTYFNKLPHDQLPTVQAFFDDVFSDTKTYTN